MISLFSNEDIYLPQAVLYPQHSPLELNAWLRARLDTLTAFLVFRRLPRFELRLLTPRSPLGIMRGLLTAPGDSLELSSTARVTTMVPRISRRTVKPTGAPTTLATGRHQSLHLQASRTKTTCAAMHSITVPDAFPYLSFVQTPRRNNSGRIGRPGVSRSLRPRRGFAGKQYYKGIMPACGCIAGVECTLEFTCPSFLTVDREARGRANQYFGPPELLAT